MFVPSNGPVTRDDLNDPTGYVFENQDAQDIREGALRLIPTGIPTLPEDLNWPKIAWTRADELPSFPDNIANRWKCTFNNQNVGSPQTFEFETSSNFLDIDTVPGEYQQLRQKAGDGGLRELWPDNVLNSTGWVIQFRAQVIEDDTGVTKYHGHYIDFDDGTHHERIYLHADGLYFEQNPSLNVQYDLRSQPREIRIGARQDDLYILLDDGRGFAALDSFTGDSTAAELSFGTTGVVSRYRTVWDYVHVYTDGLVVDTPPDVPRVYSTTPVAATTPAFSPKKPVHRWVAAYLETSGDLVNGTTIVTVEYKSSVATEWTEFGDFTVDEIGQFEILLDNVPTAEDGTDELRFVISQTSVDGLGEPPRIEQITILGDFEVDGIRAVPHWGHRAGGNTVALELNQNSDSMFLVPSRGNERLLVPFDGDYVATVGSDTGTPSGTVTAIDGKFDGGIQLGSQTAFVDQTLTPFTNLPPFGALGLDVTAEHSTTGYLTLSESQVEEDQTVYEAQAAVAQLAGDGYSLPVDTDTRFLLEVNEGAVEVSDGTQTHVFYADDYWTAQPVSLLGLGATLTFRSAVAGSSWRAGRFQGFTPASGQVEFDNTYGETGLLGFAVDVYVNPNLQGDQAVLSTLNGNDGWEIGLTPGGFPYARIGDGTTLDAVTGLTPVICERWTNLALNYRRYTDHTGLQILVNGAVSAEKTTTCTTVSDGVTMLAGAGLMGLDQLRVHPGSIDAADFSQDNGFTAPYLEVETAVPPDDENELVLNFYENGGAFADASGKDHHPYAATVGRRYIYRDRRLAADRITGFWLGGKIHVKHTPDQVISLPHTIYGEVALQPNTQFAGLIYEKWNAGRTVGFGIYLTTAGVLQVVVNDGVNEWTEYSNYLLADQVLRPFAVTITSTDFTIRVNGSSDTFTHATGSLAAATEDATIGYGLMGYVRNLTVRNATLSSVDYDLWRNHSESKWAPSDTVYVDGAALAEDRVLHAGPNRKFLRMPPGEPGYVTIEMDSGNRVYFAERPYKYTYGYHRELPDRILNKVAGTKSPFRLVTEVPSNGVNLAYVQQPDISVGQNVSVIDLSYKQAENLATYFGGDFLLHPPTTGLGLLDYTGQVDTENLLLSNRSAGWKDQAEPAPLFYKYQVGRGRFYVYQPNAVTVDDAQVIRNGINIIADHGRPLPFEDFSWDIEVSTVDVHGVALPTNVFSVMLYSTQRYIPGSSVLVQYYAADSLNDWKKVPSFLEIVNTEPIFTPTEETPGIDEYSLSLREDGTLDIQVGTV